MSESHLKILKNKLQENNWTISIELPGNKYDISAIWVVTRPNGNNKFSIEFEGFDDLNCLPIEKAYACRIKDEKDVNLYFGKISKGNWNNDLDKFIKKINNLL